MASMTRRIKRMMNKTSQHVPRFTPRELNKLDEPTREALASRIAEVQADAPAPANDTEPEAAPEPVPETVEAAPKPEATPECEAAPEPLKGTYCTLADGTRHGPFKNQTEAKTSVKESLGLARMPVGAKFERV